MDDFQKQALTSVAITTKDMAALAHLTLGLSGEAGVLANQIKKIVRDKSGQADTADLEVIRKRLGDVMYYAAVLAEYFDLSLADLAAQNLEQSAAFKRAREANSK